MSALRESFRYPHGDPSILLFDRAVQAWPEMDLPEGARVLELGCCETDFSHWLTAARPDVQLTGVDVNACPDFRGTFVQCDAQDMAHVPATPEDAAKGRDDVTRRLRPREGFAPSSVEAVIILGALEHFGLGFYGDRVDEAGDRAALKVAYDLLVPGGWLYYDVPWTPTTGYITENRHFRVYDDAQLAQMDRYARQDWRPLRRTYAHGETTAPQPIRPPSPTTPFWYVARLVGKDA